MYERKKNIFKGPRIFFKFIFFARFNKLTIVSFDSINFKTSCTMCGIIQCIGKFITHPSRRHCTRVERPARQLLRPLTLLPKTTTTVALAGCASSRRAILAPTEHRHGILFRPPQNKVKIPMSLVDVPYVSEREWNGCVFPRPAASLPVQYRQIKYAVLVRTWSGRIN